MAKQIDPTILAQLQNLDNPGPNALRPKVGSKAPKKSGEYSQKYGLENGNYKAGKNQQLYTPALSLAEHQQVSNQAYKDSARQTALDYSYAKKASKLNQELGQQDFKFQSDITGFNRRLEAGQDANRQSSFARQQNSATQNTLLTQGRNDRNLNRINALAGINQTGIQTQAQRDMHLQTLSAQESASNKDRAATLATARLQADTQRAIASESNRYSLANNILSGSRAGYRYW